MSGNITIRNRRCFARLEPMRVYRNLHKDCWSIQQKNTKGRWLVVAHTDSITLRDCELRVSEAGRQRVLKEGRKNVHAYIQGYWVPDSLAVETFWDASCFRRDLKAVVISYYPKHAGHFAVYGDREPIEEAALVYMPEGVSFTKAWI